MSHWQTIYVIRFHFALNVTQRDSWIYFIPPDCMCLFCLHSLATSAALHCKRHTKLDHFEHFPSTCLNYTQTHKKKHTMNSYSTNDWNCLSAVHQLHTLATKPAKCMHDSSTSRARGIRVVSNDERKKMYNKNEYVQKCIRLANYSHYLHLVVFVW